jgi:IS5 family transposase
VVLQARGAKLESGTIVDATLIGAPSSTKNKEKARDPEMHQARKGQQWYFGMKLHIGVDSRSGLAKNANRAFVALALANLYMWRGRSTAQVRP